MNVNCMKQTTKGPSGPASSTFMGTKQLLLCYLKHFNSVGLSLQIQLRGSKYIFFPSFFNNSAPADLCPLSVLRTFDLTITKSSHAESGKKYPISEFEFRFETEDFREALKSWP